MRFFFRILCGVLIALALGAAQTVSAQDGPVDESPPEHVAWDGNRLSLRFSSAPLSIRLSWDRNGIGSFAAPIIGMEASLTLSNQWTFELAGQWLLGQYGYSSQGNTVSGRAGYCIPLHGSGIHRSGFLVPLVGYGYGRRPGWEGSEGYRNIDETHTAEATLAYDYFSGWRNTFTLRALVGFDYVLSSTLHDWWYTSATHMRYGVRAAVLVGASFRSLGETGEGERASARPEIRTGGARLSMRFTSAPLSFEFSDREYGADHLDISVVELSLTLPSSWTMELSMGFMFTQRDSTGMSGTGRLGYSVPIAESHDDTLTVFLVPLLGYRYARRPVEGTSASNDTHSLQVGAALDLLVGRGSALSLRLFGAYEYAFVSEYFYRSAPSGPDLKPMTYSIQYGLLVGFTFRGIGGGS